MSNFYFNALVTTQRYVLFNRIQFAVCAVHANTGGAVPVVKPNMPCIHSHCEASRILRVKGETFLQGMCANRNVYRRTEAIVVIFLPQTADGCSSGCRNPWSTAQKKRNHNAGSASALLIPPPFSFHPSPSPEFQMGMNVFLPALLKAAY